MTERKGMGSAAWNHDPKSLALLGLGQSYSKGGVFYSPKRMSVLLTQALGGMISYSEENACPPIGKMCVEITAVTTNKMKMHSITVNSELGQKLSGSSYCCSGN